MTNSDGQYYGVLAEKGRVGITTPMNFYCCLCKKIWSGFIRDLFYPNCPCGCANPLNDIVWEPSSDNK